MKELIQKLRNLGLGLSEEEYSKFSDTIDEIEEEHEEKIIETEDMILGEFLYGLRFNNNVTDEDYKKIENLVNDFRFSKHLK